MFKASCQQYAKLLCQIGCGDLTTGGRRGLGCFLSTTHVITALHVVKAISEAGLPMAVTGMSPPGMSRCRIVSEFADLDLCVLELTEPIDGQPVVCEAKEFPQLADLPCASGETLGYFSLFKLPDDLNSQRVISYRLFSAASLASQWNHAGMWLLSGGLASPGVSGAPAWRADGTFMGVLVAAVRYNMTEGWPDAELRTLPVLAPIVGIRERLLDLLKSSPSPS